MQKPEREDEAVTTAPESRRLLVQEAEPQLSSNTEFSELRRLIKTGNRPPWTPAFPWSTVAILLVMIAVVLAVMILWHTNVAVQAVNGILFGFVVTQIGFLMHDAGHGQVFRSAADNRAMGLVCANLLVGISYEWWIDKHGRHHRNPNHIGIDPDVNFTALAFCERQAMEKSWPWKSIVRYQAFLFVPFLLAEHLSLQMLSVQHLLHGQVKHRATEGVLLVCHHIVGLGIAFTLLGAHPAIAFLATSKAFAGLYAGLVFAPNHKGMLMVDAGSQLSVFRRQVLTSRNVRSGWINDFLYGGLNYQIEHHLFPFLRRDQMAAAQRIVRPFCSERGIRYHETGVFQSLKETFHHLHRVGASIRCRQFFDDSESLG